VLVGHLLERAAQVSGGYIAQPGVFDVPNLHADGFPLAEVQANGSAVISELPGTGGRINRLTCTARRLYEIENPAAYLQPDVVADFSAVQLQEEGEGLDRVHVSGASGHARPAALRVTLGYLDGCIGEGQIGYAGPGARARRVGLVHPVPPAGTEGPERSAGLRTPCRTDRRERVARSATRR